LQPDWSIAHWQQEWQNVNSDRRANPTRVRGEEQEGLLSRIVAGQEEEEEYLHQQELTPTNVYREHPAYMNLQPIYPRIHSSTLYDYPPFRQPVEFFENPDLQTLAPFVAHEDMMQLTTDIHGLLPDFNFADWIPADPAPLHRTNSEQQVFISVVYTNFTWLLN
uniref:Uncharacterized protein n=1 Tax=Parascaris equorum TaxID=6256 RepID=A0A914RA17_PAREQ